MATVGMGSVATASMQRSMRHSYATPSSPLAKPVNCAMSVPATNAWPPAPRKVTTRTAASPESRWQISTSASYIAHVIALRAAGRSNTTRATPSATVSRTVPSVVMGEGSACRQLGTVRRADAHFGQHLVGVLAEQRRMAAHLLRRAHQLHRKADVGHLAPPRRVDLPAHAARLRGL